MSDSANLLERWLPKVVADTILVDVSEAGRIAEALGNLWGFSLAMEEAEQLDEESVLAFLQAVSDARERQILERFGRTNPMVFYCWFDEQMGELRFSLVSVSHGRTGFGGEVESVADPCEIVQAFLQSTYPDGIPIKEFREMTEVDIATYGEPPAIMPRVWSTTLPQEPR